MTNGDGPIKPTFADIFLDLEQSYLHGNKAALYDAVSRSQKTERGLPVWAAEALKDLILERWNGKTKTWKGKTFDDDGGYKKIISRFIRAEVYGSVMLWLKNKRNYKRMPTKCIKDWYDGKLQDLPTVKEKAALKLTLDALAGTIAGMVSETVVKEDRYYGVFAHAEQEDFTDDEMAASLEMSPKEYEAFMMESFRDSLRLPLSFGYNASEVVFGLRPEGQFWGPPCDPPDHIQSILDAEPPLNGDN